MSGDNEKRVGPREGQVHLLLTGSLERGQVRIAAPLVVAGPPGVRLTSCKVNGAEVHPGTLAGSVLAADDCIAVTLKRAEADEPSGRFLEDW